MQKYISPDVRAAAEQKRPGINVIAEGYGLTFTSTEIDLLMYPESLLDPIEKQRLHLLRVGLQSSQCPACHGLICQRSAALTAKDPDEPTPVTPQRSRSSDADYECNRCGVKLTYWVQLFGGGTGFDLTEPIRPQK
jgi:hypothetical protein